MWCSKCYLSTKVASRRYQNENGRIVPLFGEIMADQIKAQHWRSPIIHIVAHQCWCFQWAGDNGRSTVFYLWPFLSFLPAHANTHTSSVFVRSFIDLKHFPAPCLCAIKTNSPPDPNRKVNPILTPTQKPNLNPQAILSTIENIWNKDHMPTLIAWLCLLILIILNVSETS